VTQGPRLVLIGSAATSLGVLLALWPGLAVAACAVALVAALALRAPGYSFVLAVALFGFEGTLKEMLTFDAVPIPVSGTTLGAGVLDLCLLVAAAGLLLRGRSSLREAWGHADRAVRIGMLLLTAWVVLAVMQIPQGGDLVQGVDGFRLIHWYALVAVGGVLLARGEERVLQTFLALLLIVAGYGALRAVIGPSTQERIFALNRPGVTQYISAFRDVGSFSGAVGLASFLAPAGIFGFVLALISPRTRLLGVGVAICALVAVIDSFARVAVVAMLIAAVAAAVLTLRLADVSLRHKVLVLAAILIALTAGAIGTTVASRNSQQLRARVQVFIHPLADRSVRLRLDTWRDSLREAAHHPFGTGLGTVGRASTISGEPAVTTDNTYLQILQEQGFLGAGLFVLGIIVTLGGLVVGAGRAPDDRRPLAIAAVSAFLCFVVLGAAGEYFEQPGKVLAWMFLGLAVGAVSAPSVARKVEADR
jgi:hypothetical protein